MLAALIASRVPDVSPEVLPGREQLSAVATSIALRFRPARIVLFGSRGAGTSTEGSDVDLLVVMETSLRPPEQAAHIRQSLKLQPPFGLDVLVRTPEQIGMGLRDGDLFIEDVMVRGAILYEASDAGLDG